MESLTKKNKYNKNAAFVVGFVFIILGVSTQAETSWLFTIGGLLSIAQGLYLQYKEE